MRTLFGVLLLTLSACTSTALKTPLNVPKQVTLRFKGRTGEVTETKYHSIERTRAFSEMQILRDKQEVVDFTVRTKTLKADELLIATNVETSHKDGNVDLHDLAFPELHESMEFVTKPDGTVLRAGKYPPQSIFFLPSMPIPDQPVAIGDTWPMERGWLSARDGIPMKLSVVGILKNIVACEGAKLCAEVEVSGDVTVGIPPTVAGARFDSRVWGKVLFSLDRGDVIWSEMRSQEEMVAGKDRSTTTSCIVSQMVGAESHQKFICELQ